jgi:predicted exporter
MQSHADNHGQTPAAWAAVIIATLGFLVGAYAVVVSAVWLFWVAVGIVVVGGIVGWVLKAMGFGQDSTPVHPAGR